MSNNIIARSQQIRKIRENLYQLPQGQLVGFGPVEAENGISWCYNCYDPECQHVQAVSDAWLDGMSVEAQSGTFNGYHTPATATAPPMSGTVVTQTDIDAVERGNRPGAWKAQSREELPSGWPMAQVKR